MGTGLQSEMVGVKDLVSAQQHSEVRGSCFGLASFWSHGHGGMCEVSSLSMFAGSV